MDYKSLNDVIQYLSDNDNFLIVIHDKPDGDAVGSSTALALFLQSLGKTSAVLSPSVIPARLAFAKSNNVKYIEGTDALTTTGYGYNAVISIDVASPELISSVTPLLSKEIELVIDHHRVNTLEADLKYIDSASSAAGEIVFSLISMYSMVMNEDYFSKEICEALFTSISSDTGCFKYGNTTAATHEIASSLLRYGINAEEINRLLFDTKSFTQIKAEQLAYQKLQMHYDCKLAITCIDKSDLDRIGATEEDTETISQLTRMIAGVQIGVMMREKISSDGKTGYKFSVRANSEADVSALCAKFGGGGHKKAAGCTICGDKQTALETFIKAAEEYII